MGAHLNCTSFQRFKRVSFYVIYHGWSNFSSPSFGKVGLRVLLSESLIVCIYFETNRSGVRPVWQIVSKLVFSSQGERCSLIKGTRSEQVDLS